MRKGLLSPTDLNEPVDPNDPFPYGWRYVKRLSPNGAGQLKKTPLTLEDILHPEEEDCHLPSDPHTEDTCYLRNSFRIRLVKTRGAVVLSDCRIAWDRRGKYAHSPDCAVIFKVRKKQRWSTFNVVLEKTKPSLVVEITSPKTRSTDLVDKVAEFAVQGVPHYVIADAHEDENGRWISLLDHHLSPQGGAYYTLPPNENGRVWLPEVDLWLGAEDGQLVCFDKRGKRIATNVEEHQARLEAEQKAAALAARVKQLEELVKAKPTGNGRNGRSGK